MDYPLAVTSLTPGTMELFQIEFGGKRDWISEGVDQRRTWGYVIWVTWETSKAGLYLSNSYSWLSLMVMVLNAA